MARQSKATRKSRTRAPSRRTQIVWASFIGAMTLVMGAFSMNRAELRGGFLATNLAALTSADNPRTHTAASPLFQLDAPLRPWQSIVIHDLGKPAGDPQSIHRQHLAWGFQGLGYHFLIGNGNGLGDGIIHVGYRWNEQLPGAHVAGPAGALHNQHSIGICLIGNGDRRGFTDRQMEQLTLLVQQLQRQLGIPASQVHLHRDLADDTTSPGAFFPAARLREQLLIDPR